MTDSNTTDERFEQLAHEAYDVIATEMTNYGLFDALIQLKRFIASARLKGLHDGLFDIGGQKMGYHVFPFLSDLIIRYTTTLAPRRRFSDDTLGWLISRYVGFPDPLTATPNPQRRRERTWEWLVRVAFEQLPHQQMTRTLLQRAVFLYDEIPRLYPSRHHSFRQSLGEVVRNQFRVSLHDYLYCGFALGAIARTADFFEEDLTTEVEWMKPYVETDAIRIVRNQLSLTREEYKARVNRSWSGRYSYIKTEPQLICKFPIIQLDNQYLCPDPSWLLSSVTVLLHDSIYEYFIGNERIQDYAGTFGGAFKDYVGLLLRECFGTESVYDLDRLDCFSARRADWVVIQGDNAAIFECKGLRYPKELKRTGSLSILDSFFSQKIQPALVQLVATEQQWPSIAQQIPAASRVTNFFKCLVLEEHFQFANVCGDFCRGNSAMQLPSQCCANIMSLLDLETLSLANCGLNLSDLFGGWQSCLSDKPTLEQFIREHPCIDFDGDTILDRKFSDFFHGLPSEERN